MLTIKAPIALKCAKAISSSYEAFGQRIAGNYQLTAAQMEREDLLHAVMAPPEIYLGGGGTTSILQDTRIQNNRETKLEVINNLLNRISVTGEVNLTYQDRVYITDVLYKLGVTNASQFMRQLSLLKQETRNVSELTDLYWNHLKELNQRVEQYENSFAVQRTSEETYGSQTRLYLHEEILNRLKTGALYQILNNFYSGSSENSTQADGQELTFSEQQRMVSRILLNRLQSQTVGKQVPLEYRHENFYEENRLEGTQVTQETVNSQITSAVLLNLADSLYQNLSEKNIRSGRIWIHVERALYQTAENTLKRLSYAFTEQSAHTSIHQEMMVSQVNAQEREIDSLREILSLGSPREAHLPKDVTSETLDEQQENPEPVPSAEMIFPQGDFKQNPEAPFQESQIEAEGWTKEVHTGRAEKEAKTPAGGTVDKKHPPNERTQQTASKKMPGKTGEGAGQPVLSNEKQEFSDEAAVQKPILSETVIGQSLKTATTGDRTPEEIPGSRKESAEREGDYFEQILNRYLSIVYHTEQEARTEIHPLNLSVRTGEEAESWENVQVMEAGTEQTGEKAFLKQAEAFPPGQVLSEGGNGGEPQLFPPAAEKERGYFTDGKETGKFVHEPESRRERIGHPTQEIPVQLVHPAGEESETPGMNESGKPTREQPQEVPSEGKTAQSAEPADTFGQAERGNASDKGETVLLKEVRQISQQLHTERETRSEELMSLDRTRQWIQRESAFTEKETVREADLYLAQGNPEEEETPGRSLPLESGQPVPQEPAQNPGATQIIQRTTEHILQQMETQRQSLVTQTAQALERDARAEYVQTEPILLKTEGRPESEEEQKPLQQRDFPPPAIQGDLVNIWQNSEQVNLYYDGQNSSDGQEATEKGDEEQLIDQLQEINRRNVQNYQRYQELLKVRQEEEKRQRQKEKPAAMKMREESLKALENPQLVIEEHFKKSPQEGKTLSAARQAMEDLIPEETRAVYEKVLEMQQARLTSADQGEAERNTSLNEFIYDISQTGWENEPQTPELPENQREILQATDRVIEQRREYENVSLPADNREWTESRNLSLIHKSQENRLDEEELMELLTQNSLLERNTSVTNRVEERNREENIVVRQQNTSTRYEEKEDMETLIQRGVQRQMGVLSDQIYSRLERRLANEKKRRGY